MSSYEFKDVVERIVQHKINYNVYTSVPARIINVDNFEEEQTVDVAFMLNTTYEDGVIMALPNVLSVPVVFPSAGKGILSFPIEVDDTVLLTFSMKSLEEWINATFDGEEKTISPADDRSHSINDAIAIPGLYTRKTNLKPNGTDVELKLLDDNKEVLSSIKLKPDGDVTVDNAKDVIVNTQGQISITAGTTVTVTNGSGTITLQESGDVDINGAIIDTGGDVTTASGISLDNHTHEGSPTAGTGPQSDTGAPK